MKVYLVSTSYRYELRREHSYLCPSDDMHIQPNLCRVFSSFDEAKAFMRHSSRERLATYLKHLIDAPDRSFHFEDYNDSAELFIKEFEDGKLTHRTTWTWEVTELEVESWPPEERGEDDE